MPSKDKTSAIQCECRLLNLLFIYVRSKKASKMLLAKRNLAILRRRKAVGTISSIFQLLNLVRKLFLFLFWNTYLLFVSFWVHFLKVLNIELWICCVPDWNGEDWIMKPPTLLSCWRNNFGIPDFLFSNSKRKSIKYEKKSCFFWETVIKVLFFLWMDGVEEEEEIDDVQMKMEDRKLLFLDNLTRLLGQGIQLSNDLYYY